VAANPTSGGFFAFAVDYARSRGYQFGPGALQDLEAACTRAELDAADHQLRLSPDQVRENIASWIDVMIASRRQVYTDRPELMDGNIIGEDTFARARGFFCPGFYPFC
jgi:hypothetical protein